MVKFVYGFLPAFITYKEIEGEVKNFALRYKITIQPKYKCDEGILHHELEHVKQWYSGGFSIYGLRYKKSKNYRLKCEAKAYLKQMDYKRCDGSYLTLDGAAERLMWSRYDLGLTKDQALQCLKEIN